LDALRKADGKSLTTAAIARSIMTDKDFPIDEGALLAAMTDMAITVLRRLSKRGTVTKSGTSRNAQWTLATPLL
jgi:hypothetical protein